MSLPSFLKKVAFWNAVRDTLFYLGAPSTLGLFAANKEGLVSDACVYAAGMATFLGGLISKWIVDSDNNGRIDWFENDNTKHQTP